VQSRTGADNRRAGTVEMIAWGALVLLLGISQLSLLSIPVALALAFTRMRQNRRADRIALVALAFLATLVAFLLSYWGTFGDPKDIVEVEPQQSVSYP
jgi:K+-transporting ATPase A subunit